MSRLRAVEHGRAVLVAATSGISAIIAPDGPVVQSLPEFDAGLPGRRRCRCATTLTVADRVGAGPGVGRDCGRPGRARPGASRPALRQRRAMDVRSTDPEPTRGAGAVTQRPFADLGRIVVIVPTYNERENIERIVGRVRAAVPEADVLVADDNSPDGTGELADELAAADDAGARPAPGRQGGPGRGLPRRLRLGAGRTATTSLVEMDADGSHQPEQLPGCSTRCATPTWSWARAGSPGGAVVNWPRWRELLSRGGNIYSPDGARPAAARHHRRLPGVPGRRRCASSTWTRSQRQGYCFQVDLAWRAVRAGLTGRRGPDHVRRARARRLAR